MVKMEIKGLLMDPVSNMPVVILRDENDGVFLPIWVGLFEANAIAIEMEKVQAPRPMTHNLLKNLIGERGIRGSRELVRRARVRCPPAGGADGAPRGFGGAARSSHGAARLMDAVSFVVCAAAALVGAVGVIISRNPVH